MGGRFVELSKRDKELLERTQKILEGNIYPSAGYPWSPHRCVTPGCQVFDGIWNWDSAFHAVGLARMNTELAKESVRGFFKFQHDNGFLPDCIREDGSIVDALSKPPVFAWACEIIYHIDQDAGFIKELYPKLKRNADWWYDNRCYNGLFFYDAEEKESEDYIRYVKYESGWDNSVRWDKGITEYWAIDLNCFMVMFMRAMNNLAHSLGLKQDCAIWKEKENSLIDLINRCLWDSEKGLYGDTNKLTGETSFVLTPANFMPLFINIASKERAVHMADFAKSNFKEKMPTVSFDNPEYSTDYWRGPTWLNVAYFAAKGLKNYGFEVANKIKENILNMCYNEKRGIYENYDSETGKGLCCDHFSWSCVFIREFILNW